MLPLACIGALDRIEGALVHLVRLSGHVRQRHCRRLLPRMRLKTRSVSGSKCVEIAGRLHVAFPVLACQSLPGLDFRVLVDRSTAEKSLWHVPWRLKRARVDGHGIGCGGRVDVARVDLVVSQQDMSRSSMALQGLSWVIVARRRLDLLSFCDGIGRARFFNFRQATESTNHTKRSTCGGIWKDGGRVGA